ncbi:uncharacterized protein N7529_009070 [Penicillium soppii]|uniref:uncharacterized protein n=1 Tax=Penicillium soppii TaxID=69789 RepID=UPI0025497EE0|nr:uncharacterized protein N7529_009070 [Penicillium soppii]KAJ5861760.1 hypothetical protein N7529_009070 [Penicillium soppii]
MHRKYGHVVRIAPDTLSYTCSEAWNGSMRDNFSKDPKYYIRSDRDTSNISNANDHDHSRLRRAQAHGFSLKALSLQESFVQKYVEQVISRLGEEVVSTARGAINVVR